MEGELSPSYMYIVPTSGCLGYLCPGNCDCFSPLDIVPQCI